MISTLTPAYGRDYKSAKALALDWNANKDFINAGLGGGSYINRADIAAIGTREIQARYKRLTAVCVLRLDETGTATHVNGKKL